MSQTGKRWEENHWVVRVARGRWQKTQLGKERAEWLSQSVQFPSAGLDLIGDTLSDGAAS